jgi:hypothetical protein
MKREIVVAAIVALSASGIASAQNPSTISSNFSTFAGSTENSDSLVTGLRSGGLITLSSTDAAGVTTTTTFDTPTGKMGYGNVNKSLLLARQQLADVGITQPTNAQIQASLVGGEVIVPGQTTPTQLQGVLTMRAGGMGWGQISKTLGHNLGSVVSGRATTPVVAPTPLPASAATKASATGVTNASGASATGVTTAAGSSHGQGNAYGRGITTGAGGSAGQGQGNAYGRGITTGAGGNSGNAGQARGVGKGG